MKKIMIVLLFIALTWTVFHQEKRITILESTLTEFQSTFTQLSSIPSRVTIVDEQDGVSTVLPNVIEGVVGIRVDATIRQQSWFGERDVLISGSGSGFFIRSDGYLITNAHVVENAYQNNRSTITVVMIDGSSHEASIIKYNRDIDLALLKIEASVSPLQFGSPENMLLGQDVFAIGYPLGFDLSLSITKGIISGLNRNLGNGVPLVQTDAAINPGNSGGPLFNMQGQVIGVNSSKIASAIIEGIGFAIMSEVVLEFISDVIELET